MARCQYPRFTSDGIVSARTARAGLRGRPERRYRIALCPGGPQQLPDLAADLVRTNVDVIWTAGDLATKLAQQATATIPIVALADDMLAAGLVTSLSRPGGNTTGLTILASELSAKRLELLKDIFQESHELPPFGTQRPVRRR